MPTYAFLSDEWIQEVRVIFEEYRGQAEAQAAATSIRMNQVITEVPFGDGTIEAHVDSSSGELLLEMGPMEGADVKVTLDYDIARDIFVSADLQAATQAFMAGRIKIEGDMTVLIVALQQQAGAGAPPAAQEVRRRIQEITE